MWNFADNHPWCTAVIVIATVWAIASLLRLPFIAYTRTLRFYQIKQHGWPTNPVMDADGDICHPKHG